MEMRNWYFLPALLWVNLFFFNEDKYGEDRRQMWLRDQIK